MTLLQKAEQISPRTCRLIARKSNGRKPMSTADIAKRCGLSKSYVATLSLRDSWKGIPIDTVVLFAAACGVNHLSAIRPRDYIKRRKMHHIHTGTKAQRKYYAKLVTL